MDVTGKAIAERLGISTATVSLALNNRQGVNPQTREAVLACREELRQNRASAPAVNKVMLINTGAEVPSEFAVFQQSYTELFEVLNNHGYLLQTASYSHTPDTLLPLLEQAEAEGVSGLIIFAIDMPDDCLRLLHRIKAPTAIFDNDYRLPKGDNFLIDNYGGIASAVDLLSLHGRTDLHYITNGKENYFNFQDRRRALKQILSERPGLTANTVPFGQTPAEMRQNALAFLQNHQERPLAVVTENYQVSLGLLFAAQQLGLRVPEDIDLVCFDELPEEVMLPWPVPIIRVYHSSRARTAVHRLMDRMEGYDGPGITFSVRTQLMNTGN